ncbi:anti-phage ZorAB system protein ZorA [Paraburkholderia sp. DD10]|uniref:anti-phage ZorAB system protein ZorA n=1 Tax=Paraburkholderia sp. DD10 TaxID=3409691 RepID=UPI003BA03CB6
MNIETILHAPLIARVCAGFIALLVCLFFFHFGWRSRTRRLTLDEIIRGLKKLGPNDDPGTLFSRYPDLEHLWKEFDETLLAETEFDSTVGEYKVTQMRATLPAEQYFSNQAVVDSYVWAEFYKHLPGILTGIGIIGTFFGILHGLQTFNISDNADLVRKSLGGLLGSVSEAFLVSACAITSAIVITFFEKALLSRLYKKTEDLVVEIDKRYQAGAGEAMLQNLVHSTREYVSNSKVLKDSLVTDLKGILTTLSESQIQAQQAILEKQIAAQSRTSEELGKQIGEQVSQGIKTALEEPMRDISDALKGAAGDRSTAVHSLLTEVVQGLSQSLKDLFGDQIAGINTMQQQTISALQSAVARMEQMSASLETAGTRATDTMAKKLEEAITSMNTRQELMAQHMARIVEEMRSSVATSQTETNTRLHEALTGVSTTIEALIASLSKSVASSQDATNEKLQSALTGVTQTIETLVATLSQSVATSQDATNEKLQSTLAGVSQTMESLVATLSQTVATSQDSTSEKLQSTLAGVSQTIETLVSTLSQSVASSQDTTNDKLQSTLAGVTQTVEELVASLSQNVATAQNQTNGHLQETMSNVSNAVQTLVSGLSTSVANTQAEASSKLQEAVSSVGQTVNSLVSGLSDQAATADAAHLARQNELSAQAQAAANGVRSAVDTLTGEIRTLIAGTRTAVDTMRLSVDSMRTGVDSMRSGVDSMRTVTSDTVTRMNSGAETMYVASSEFSKAGTSVAGVLQQATNTTDKLAAAAGNVGTASQAMQSVVNDYRASRDQMGQMLTELTRVVENARTDASLTSDVLSRIADATRALNNAQVDAQEFMEGVTDVLSTSQKQFQQSLTHSMSEALRELVGGTTRVTGLLGQTIEELQRAVELVVPSQEA